MYGWGQALSWATLMFAWLMAFAVGIAIYFIPIARLLDSLTE
jgi:hypothetical protein